MRDEDEEEEEDEDEEEEERELREENGARQGCEARLHPLLFPTMTVTFQLPDRAAATLRNAWDDLSQAALESLAVEGYRSGKLSCAQVGDLLGYKSRWEAEDFLAAHGVWPGSTVEDLESDLATLDRLRQP